MTALATAPQQSGPLVSLATDRRPVVQGLIKCGNKLAPREGKTNQLPKALDHFLITTLQRGSDNNFLLDEPLMNSLPQDADGKIRRLPVTILSNNLNEVVRQQWLWYVGQRKVGWSENGKLILIYHPRTEKPLDTPMKIDLNPEGGDQHEDVADLFREGKFKLQTDFYCTIRGDVRYVRFGGVYRLRTSGGINASQIPASLNALRDWTGGFLRLLPMELVIRPQAVCPMVKGVPTPSTVHVVHLEMQGPDVAASGGLAQMAVREMKRQIENAREMFALQRTYSRLVSNSELLADLDEEEPGVTVPALPVASTSVRPPTPTVNGESFFNTLALRETQATFDADCELIRREWRKIAPEWQQKLIALKAEVQARITAAKTAEGTGEPQEGEEKF